MQATKKTYLLPQQLINQVKKTLHAKSETEAIIRAMQEVILQDKLINWHKQNKGQLSVKNIYAASY